MSISKFIPIKDIIYDTFEDMGIDINHDYPTFKRWALKAESHISSFYSLKKETIVLTVKGCIATLPDRFRIVRAVVNGDCGCDCGDLIENTLFNSLNNNSLTGFSPGQVFLSIDVPESGQVFGSLKYNIVDNKIVFNQNLDTQKVTVQGRALQEDCNGELMVSENHDEAIMFFLMYRYALRSKFSPNKMERSETEDLLIKWRMARDGARADDAKLTASERAEIVDMIHDPYVGWGMEAGMKTPDDGNYGGRSY